MKKIIIANWKMNNGFDEVDEWIEGFYKVYSSNLKDDKNVEVVLCPPFILLDYIDMTFSYHLLFERIKMFEFYLSMLECELPLMQPAIHFLFLFLYCK